MKVSKKNIKIISKLILINQTALFYAYERLAIL